MPAALTVGLAFQLAALTRAQSGSANPGVGFGLSATGRKALGRDQPSPLGAVLNAPLPVGLWGDAFVGSLDPPGHPFVGLNWIALPSLLLISGLCPGWLCCCSLNRAVLPQPTLRPGAQRFGEMPQLVVADSKQGSTTVQLHGLPLELLPSALTERGGPSLVSPCPTSSEA